MRGLVGQDRNLLMTLSMGRLTMWLTPFTEIFPEIFESLSFDCLCYSNSKVPILYLLSLWFLSIIIIRNKTEKSDHVQTTQLIKIAN